MDLMKIKNDIPDIVYMWAEQHGENTCYSFVSIISYQYGEIVERTFGVRKYAKQGTLITEVQRRATGDNSDTVVKNLLVSPFGYIPVFESEDRYFNSRGYSFKVFDKSDFDAWYVADKQCGFHTICLNKEILFEIEEFKYCGYSTGDVIAYLNEYRKTPLIEFFGKCGLPISSSLITMASKDKQFRSFICKNSDSVRAYGPRATKYAYQHNMSISDANRRLNNRRMALRHIPKMRGAKLDYERIVDWCDAKKIDYSLYNDYIEAVIGLKLDLNDTKNIYPKKFKAMHDLRISEYESQKEKIDRRKRKKLYKAFAKAGEKATAYECSNDIYSIISPKDISDLIREGKILNHCVGKMGYDKKMADQEIVIMFVRKAEDINKPFVTLEYSLKQHRLMQTYGKENSKPSNETMNFINEWVGMMNKLSKVNA